MEKEHGKNRSPELSEEREDSQLKARVGGVGSFSESSAEHEFDQIGTGRENSYESNIVVVGEQSFAGINGKLIRQLVSETENQLAYHEQQSEYHERQAELLKQRVNKLKLIAENPLDSEQSQ